MEGNIEVVIPFLGDPFIQCEDVDECASGHAACGPGAICTNRVGSFTCHCPPGFTGNGRVKCTGGCCFHRYVF